VNTIQQNGDYLWKISKVGNRNIVAKAQEKSRAAEEPTILSCVFLTQLHGEQTPAHPQKDDCNSPFHCFLKAEFLLMLPVL
jgi:hypothetical protein